VSISVELVLFDVLCQALCRTLIVRFLVSDSELTCGKHCLNEIPLYRISKDVSNQNFYDKTYPHVFRIIPSSQLPV